MKKVILFILLFSIMLFNLVSSTDSSFIFKQSNPFELKIAISNNDLSPCTTCNCNVSIFYPNGSSYILNTLGTNIESYCSYTNQTDILGVYGGEMYFTDGTNSGRTSFNFEITPSGQSGITSGQSLTLFGGLGVIIIIGIFFFILFFKANNLGLKTIFISFAVMSAIIAVLFSLVIINQTLGGYENIISGYTTFWFVVKILIGIALTTLVIFALYIAIMFWRYKRGYND